jgi:glutamate--cysteine ligase
MTTSAQHIISSFLIEKFKAHQDEIHHWLNGLEGSNELPLYSSVDVRNAGFKMAVVDMNLFPAGFNNLCEHGLDDSIQHIKSAVYKRVPSCRNILIIAEEHTRNKWYLENIRILQQIIKQAGFNVRIATFLSVQPSFCEKAKYVELETALGFPVRIHCFNNIVADHSSGKDAIDLFILNNDLIQGIPDSLKHSGVPIYPSIQAGWHSRLKSHHFCYSHELICSLSKMIDLDPWFLSTLYHVVDNVNINKSEDRLRLVESATTLIKEVQSKYEEHAIDEKPYLFLKADYGTYGMGVMPIEHPDQIQELNRKKRNKLYRGKSSRVIERFLLQEGVPTIYNIDQQVSEACLYQVENNLIGGFYRSHSSKSDRESLNSSGMTFKKMCPHSSKYGDCGIHHDVNIFDIYRILARISAVAAHREITHLEATKNN